MKAKINGIENSYEIYWLNAQIRIAEGAIAEEGEAP